MSNHKIEIQEKKVTLVVCARCDTPVVFKDVTDGYDGVCPHHDEDIFDSEMLTVEESPIQFEERCYQAYLKTVDFTDHVDSVDNLESFTFECPLTQQTRKRINNWDGTTSPVVTCATTVTSDKRWTVGKCTQPSNWDVENGFIWAAYWGDSERGSFKSKESAQDFCDRKNYGLSVI